ncbi:MAG: FHA domain-containing protein [Bryobacteraceae bacterium]
MSIRTGATGAIRRIRVSTESAGVGRMFESAFRIGRREDVEFRISSDVVSRVHCEVVREYGTWYVRDKGSANGIYVNGERVSAAPVTGPTKVQLGSEGPWVYFDLEAPPAPAADPVAQAMDRYFGEGGGPASEHTMAVRQAYAQAKKKDSRKYQAVIVAAAIFAIVVAGYAWYLRRQVSQQKALALDLFYSMKTLDVDIAGVHKLVRAAGTPDGEEQLRGYRTRREAMGRTYDNFLETLQVYDKSLSPQRRLILRVARIFGESELTMPPEFVSEVERFIGQWKSSDRLINAVRRAQDHGYVEPIANELLAQGLPPQFFYVALQESNFEEMISGPPTRSGIAKGIWQFVPETAVKYGLKLGPLVDLPRPDPADDRHHWDKATPAAVAYIQDLYRTEAQGSGLLVMACYNWGEDRVLPMVRRMPPNPKERNFWKLLAMGKQRIPEETYKYVFSIASAAVIGEDPRLFGFGFDNPLGFLEQRK